MVTELPPLRLVPRPLRVRWGRALGEIEVFDEEMRCWHVIDARQAPSSWRGLAQEAKQAERLAREAGE